VLSMLVRQSESEGCGVGQCYRGGVWGGSSGKETYGSREYGQRLSHCLNSWSVDLGFCGAILLKVRARHKIAVR
jgi:hypothetical protein